MTDAHEEEDLGSDDVVGETLSGWLEKKEKSFVTGVERWRRCWFVLSAGADGTWTLSHYEHGTNMREFVGAERLAQGDRKVAYVSNIEKILFVGTKGVKFEIVFKNNSPPLSLRAVNEDVCKRWVFAILRLRDEDQKLAAPKPKRPSKFGTAVAGLVPNRPAGTLDKRRERESIKMTTTFLHDSDVFMSKAKRLKEQIERKEGTTLKRGATTRGRTRLKEKVVSQYSVDEEDAEDDHGADDFDLDVIPPPPGARDVGAASPAAPSDSTAFEEENSGYLGEARRQNGSGGSGGGGGGFLCFWSKPKQRHTARLPGPPVVAPSAQREDDRADPVDKFAFSSKQEHRARQQERDRKAAQGAATSKAKGAGKDPFDDDDDFSAGDHTLPRFNTVAGDETLPRKKYFSGIFENPREIRTGQAPQREDEPGPRMAVRPLMRGGGLPTGRIEVKTPGTEQLIKETIETSISLSGMLFDDLDAHSMHELVSRMYRVSVSAREDVVKQGEVGDSFYVIEKGFYHVYRRRDEANALPELVAEKGPKTFFGELALLYEQPARVTVRAVTDGVLWAIDRRTFFEIRKAQARKRQARKLQCLNSMEVLSENLGDEELVALADAMTEKVYKCGDIILERGATLDKVLIVGSGRVDMLVGEEVKSVLRRGESFGEWALLERATKSDVRLVASEDRTTTLTLDVEEFESLVGPLREAIKARWADNVQTMFPEAGGSARGLKAKKQGSAAAAAAEVDEYVRTTLQTIKGKHIQRQESFAETKRSTAAGSPGGVRLPSATSVQSEEFESDDSDDEDEIAVDTSTTAGELTWDNLPLPCDAVSLNDIEPLAKLGKGSFGRVHLVRIAADRSVVMTHADTEETSPLPDFMALKTLRRCFITDNGWEEMVENERHAMAEIAHHSRSRFVVNLFAAFYDRKNIYFLMELCEGGDMYGAMRRVRRDDPRLSEKDAKFYIASVLCGLESIHACQIIYRDAKPENFFLTADGYLKIADFGLAKKTNIAYTVCGTPEYMAPEIILGRGHDSAVDWWALGVFAFELIAGHSPFQGRSPMDCYEAVLGHQDPEDINFPDHAQFSKECKRFITGLLEPRKPKRTKIVRAGLAQHPFLAKFNMAKLRDGKLKAPLKPKVRDFTRFNASGFKNRYDPRFRDADVDRTSWTPKI